MADGCLRSVPEVATLPCAARSACRCWCWPEWTVSRRLQAAERAAGSGARRMSPHVASVGRNLGSKCAFMVNPLGAARDVCPHRSSVCHWSGEPPRRANALAGGGGLASGSACGAALKGVSVHGCPTSEPSCVPDRGAQAVCVVSQCSSVGPRRASSKAALGSRGRRLPGAQCGHAVMLQVPTLDASCGRAVLLQGRCGRVLLWRRNVTTLRRRWQ